MAYEITHINKQKSLIRIVGGDDARINLSQLARNSGETVQSAAISIASGVSDGHWHVYRGNDANGVLVLELPAFSHYAMGEFDFELANNATSNIYVNNTGTAGTILIQVSKTSTFNPALDTK